MNMKEIIVKSLLTVAVVWCLVFTAVLLIYPASTMALFAYLSVLVLCGAAVIALVVLVLHIIWSN